MSGLNNWVYVYAIGITKMGKTSRKQVLLLLLLLFQWELWNLSCIVYYIKSEISISQLHLDVKA